MPKQHPRTLLGRLGVVACIAAIGALALTAAGLGGVQRESYGKPIKIGILLPYTGPFGLYGKPMEATFRARFKKQHYRIAGHKVELYFVDEATDPKTAVLGATQLITQQKVDAVVCCVTGGATLAVGPVLAQRGVPQLGPIPNPSGLEEFRTAAMAAPTAGHDAEILGKYAASKLKYKTAAVIASDFSYGREVGEAFTKGFEGAGGRVTTTTWAPLGTTDFGSYLTKIGNVNAVFGGFAGADAIGFVKQYKQFGEKATLLGHGPLVTELVRTAEGPAATGIGAAFYYSSGLNFAENKDFINTMKGVDANFVPSHFTAGAWATGSAIIATVLKLKGNIKSGKQFTATLRGLKVKAPWGTLRFDRKTGYGIAPTYFYTVVNNSGTVSHKILAKIAG
jgi:branched-chain amino acid transport system substrate-binding protein